MTKQDLPSLVDDPFLRNVARAVATDLYQLASRLESESEEHNILLDAADALSDALELL